MSPSISKGRLKIQTAFYNIPIPKQPVFTISSKAPPFPPIIRNWSEQYQQSFMYNAAKCTITGFSFKPQAVGSV
ncbi:hypothetical protein l13_12460 [Neisseria weaveri ATCC 51223]|nr:hypothetical protein l13_12460 [Neisseria weaveri ATCC 51223]